MAAEICGVFPTRFTADGSPGVQTEGSAKSPEEARQEEEESSSVSLHHESCGHEGESGVSLALRVHHCPASPPCDVTEQPASRRRAGTVDATSHGDVSSALSEVH
ncbi:hypothetical protein EYF80_056357 [Liparis tanakae]|uniref:Uncharacterized protein n=1 Tax=Liparis tanakae TaxID=230148 RepID=A0A4Z2EXY5_9TELE|nr:hypothetical protein EYF80_056357 [Liparis tanakae]